MALWKVEMDVEFNFCWSSLVFRESEFQFKPNFVLGFLCESGTIHSFSIREMMCNLVKGIALSVGIKMLK